MTQPNTLDQELRSILAASCNGLDLQTATEAINEGIAVLRESIRSLAEDQKPGGMFHLLKPDAKAKTAQVTVKWIDDLFRLIEFGKGKDDGKGADLGRDWLRSLTDEQLATVTRWVEEAKGAK